MFVSVLLFLSSPVFLLLFIFLQGFSQDWYFELLTEHKWWQITVKLFFLFFWHSFVVVSNVFMFEWQEFLGWSFCLCRSLFLSILYLKSTKWTTFTLSLLLHMDFFIIESFGNQKKIEKLDCSHEEHNPFDWFVIKTVTGDGIIVLKKDQRKRGEVPKRNRLT